MGKELWACKNSPFAIGVPGTAAAVAADSIVIGLADADSRGITSIVKSK